MICGVFCSDRWWANCVLGEAVGPRAGGMTLPWFPAVSSHPLSARSVLSLERKVGRADGAQAQAGVSAAIIPVRGRPPQGEPVSTISRDPDTRRLQDP